MNLSIQKKLHISVRKPRFLFINENGGHLGFVDEIWVKSGTQIMNLSNQDISYTFICKATLKNMLERVCIYN